MPLYPEICHHDVTNENIYVDYLLKSTALFVKSLLCSCNFTGLFNSEGHNFNTLAATAHGVDTLPGATAHGVDTILYHPCVNGVHLTSSTAWVVNPKDCRVY